MLVMPEIAREPTWNCIAVIPCLNEADALYDLIVRILRQLPAVLVVDDGSVDTTAARALAAGARVVRHPSNLGKGMALQTGFKHSRALGFTWAITLDGDGQHAPEDIPLFLACAQRTGADLVVGDRTHQREKMPWLRRFVNRWMTAQISRLTGVRLPDSQCGFRLVKLNAISQMTLRAKRFEAESEVL